MIALRRNVLLFHQAALGDFVLTWPIAMAAARLWPTNRTMYVTAAGKGQLAERAIGVEWRDVEPMHGLFAEHGAVGEPVKKLLDGATLIISFVSSGHDAWATNVRRLAPHAQLLCVTPRPEGEIDRHLMTFHAEQLGEHPQLQAAAGQMIRHVAASGAVARRAAGDAIVIHPGSGGADKCWPADRFAALASSLRKQDHEVVAVIGEVERETWPRPALDQIRKAATLREPKTLVELFETLASAKLYIGNDSGPTHLGAMAGVPTIALFGRENDVTWRPVGPQVQLIKQVPIVELPVDAVLASVEQVLARTAETPAQATVDEE